MALTATALTKGGNSTAATTFQSAAVTAAAAVGSLVVVHVFCLSGSATFTCSDTKTNTWQASTSIVSNAQGKAQMFWSVITSALVSGTDKITVGGGVSTNYTMIATRYDTPSGTSATVKDVETSANNATGTTAMSAGPTSASTQANDAVVGAFSSGGTSNTFTKGGTYTADPGNPNAPTGTSRVEWGEYKEVNATGTQTADATQSGASGWHAFVVAFKLAAASGTVLPLRTLMGVGV